MLIVIVYKYYQTFLTSILEQTFVDSTKQLGQCVYAILFRVCHKQKTIADGVGAHLICRCPATRDKAISR